MIWPVSIDKFVVSIGLENIIIVETKDAVLVSPGDSQTLASAIEKIIRNPDQAEKLIDRGVKRAEFFSMQRLAGLYLNSYESILANWPQLPQINA